MTRVNEPVTVWTAVDGRPERLVWRTMRFQVSDTPTRLGVLPDVVLEFVTHPPEPSMSWRFQGTAADGDTRVFDIRLDPRRGQWELVSFWE